MRISSFCLLIGAFTTAVVVYEHVNAVGVDIESATAMFAMIFAFGLLIGRGWK